MAKESDDTQPGEDPITMRWIATRGVTQEKEWLLQTSYSRTNRLAPLGISNKHAALRGMPQLSTEQADAIAKETDIAKGAMKNKQQNLRGKRRL